MRLLLDTHSFLWFVSGSEKLSSTARGVIADLDNDAFISTASLWEIAIKASLGKLALTGPYGKLIPEQLEKNEIKELTISIDDLARVAELSLHHRDPFDRLIISQAIGRNLHIVGKDPEFDKYTVQMIW